MASMDHELFWERVDALLQLQPRPSQRAISAFALMSENSYREAMNSQSAPSYAFVDGMARYLDVSVEFLVNGFSEGRKYIPDDVSMPPNPETIFKQAKKIARGVKVREAAIQLVLSQNPPPDPRLGIVRITELFYRADRLLASQEERAAKKAAKKKTAARPTPSSR